MGGPRCPGIVKISVATLSIHYVNPPSSPVNGNWNSEPDNVDDQDCCSVNDYGLYSDELCNKQYGYICKFTTTPASGCPMSRGWRQNDLTCIFISDPLDTAQKYFWEDAKKKCNSSHHGASLMSVTSPEEMKFIMTSLAIADHQLQLPWWTGMNDQQYEGKFVWQDGSDVNDSLVLWDNGPNQDKVDTCGLMYTAGVVDNIRCDRRAKFVCDQSAVKGILSLGCGTWLRGGMSCYYKSGEKKTWSDARQACRRFGANLLKIDSVDEKYWFEHQSYQAVRYWTGLNDRDTEGQWRWDDGTTANQSLVRWNNAPSNYVSDEDCACLNNDGIYNDLPCTSKIGYICEYSRGGKCLDGWLTHEEADACYYISDTSNQTDLVTWSEASLRCSDMLKRYSAIEEGHVLAVNSESEKRWLERQLARLYNSSRPTSGPWWTALNDRATEGFWQYIRKYDNPPKMALITWNGEPNNFNGNEDCAEMYEGGRYNDDNCAILNNYICEKSIGGHIATSDGKPIGFFISTYCVCFASLLFLI
ncbi:hypothetical protein ScPMuIL_005336 [Solemya velum]